MPRRRVARIGRRSLRHLILATGGVVMLYPLFWLAISSLEPQSVIFSSGLGLLPKDMTFDNYLRGFTELAVSFGQFLINSLVLCSLGALGIIVSSSVTAYALAILRPKGTRWVLPVILGSVMLPFNVVIIPQYIMFRSIGWVGTILPMVVPRFFACDALYVYVLLQFMRNLPKDLVDASRVDGCSHWHLYKDVVLPLSVPALITVGLLSFLDIWNQFLTQLIYLSNIHTLTVPVGLSLYLDAVGSSDYGALLAMSVLSLLPLLLIFTFFQRYITEGISTQGLRG